MITKVYIAGPISHGSFSETMKRFTDTKEILEGYGYEVLCPLSNKDILQHETVLKPTGYDFAVASDQAIFRRDKWMVERSDIIFCNLFHSTRVSIGSMFELAWAYHLGKMIVLILPKENIHYHAFVLQSATVVFENIDQAYNYMKDLGVPRKLVDNNGD